MRRGDIVAIAAFGITLVLACASAARAADMPTKARQETSDDQRWTVSFDEETRYYAWWGSRGYPNTWNASGKGWQLWTPASLKLTGKPVDNWQLEFIARSGVVSSAQTTVGISGNVTTQTDTEVSGTVTYKGLNGIEPYVSLAMNLPTGRSALIGFQSFARMDPDIVGLATFGEGFNIGPVAGATFIINSDFIVAASIGYNARGSYWRDNLVNPATGFPLPGVTGAGLSTLSPGDITTVTGNFAYRWNSFTLRGNASYSWEAQTNVNGGAFYKTGNRIAVAGSVTYDWTDAIYTVLSTNWSHNNRNQVFNTFAFSPLMLEAFNSNVDVVQVSLDQRFKFGDWLVGPTASYLNRNHNDWDPTVFQFVAAKTRWGAGGGAEYTWSDHLTFRGRFEYVWIDQDAQPAVLVPAVTLNGIVLSGGWTCTF